MARRVVGLEGRPANHQRLVLHFLDGLFVRRRINLVFPKRPGQL